MQQPTIRAETTVQALPSTIWKVLTFPEYTQQYLLDCYLVSKWVNEEEIIGYIEHNNGNSILYKGRVMEALPGRQLSFTLSKLSLPGSGLQLSYFLLPDTMGTCLTLEVQHLGNDYIVNPDICNTILGKIKWLSEYF